MVLCSFTEAFSLAAIESMALHKPVVHSDVGGASEMIVPGWNGSLFPVGDTDALVEQLRLLADRAVSRTMGNNARAMVEARFSEDTMVERYEQTLLELARARAGARLATVRSGRLITEPRSVRGLHKE
jgi:glycosyltransferase involved in cell wall biosynthesis